ncbi:MAG: type I methionyl aminopeptidase [Candidatus Sungbacteria bacterium]|nr:type I methionyl aminopeptidase [Candidatus Sungbacteria bacterium]
MAITIKTKEEIDTLAEGGRRLALVLKRVAAAAAPGVSAFELDTLAERLIIGSGGVPSFKGYRVAGIRTPYPATICVSVNDEVVHAIPTKNKILREGDIVGLDIGMWYKKLCTDMAITIGVGKVSPEIERMMAVTKESLDLGIAVVRAGAHVGDIGHAVEQRLKKDMLGIIRDLAGHGVGYELHEDPFIPNFGSPHTGPELKEGMVIAIEPMSTLGTWRVVLQDDGWTYKTADGSLAAHFEHTLAVTKDGAEVLTQSV